MTILTILIIHKTLMHTFFTLFDYVKDIYLFLCNLLFIFHYRILTMKVFKYILDNFFVGF